MHKCSIMRFWALSCECKNKKVYVLKANQDNKYIKPMAIFNGLLVLTHENTVRGGGCLYGSQGVSLSLDRKAASAEDVRPTVRLKRRLTPVTSLQHVL